MYAPEIPYMDGSAHIHVLMSAEFSSFEENIILLQITENAEID